MTWKIELGGSIVYGISDGAAARDPMEFLIGSTTADWERHRDVLNADGRMVNSFSCYLFATGSNLIVIDTGFGVHAPDGMNAGHMPEEVAALGISAADVNHVVFTHMHPDHILGSINADDSPFFANATHWTLAREVAHWGTTSDQRAPAAQRVIGALGEAGVLNATEEPTSVVPGLDRFATFGHSPGHTSIRLSSGDDELVIAGDLMWTPAQIESPEWTSPFDGDPEEAVQTRTRFLADMTDSGTPFLTGHFDQPGYGRIVVTADGRRYEGLPVQPV